MPWSIWHLIFWSAALLVVWTYAGYPIWLRWRAARCRITDSCAHTSASRSVSLVIAVRNDAARLGEKIEHLLSLPSRAIREIIVVCDHCTDDTPIVAAGYADRGVKVVSYETNPAGKAGALNAGVTAATGDIVLFNDVRQTLAPDAIDRLVAWFDDPATGAVSGSLDISASQSGAGKGIDAYWSLEKRIRHWESKIDSSIGCTGAIYMIRRELYLPIPADTILDDLVIPMSIALRGHRVRFDPKANAFDPQQLTQNNEARRKTRTLAGNFQTFFRHPAWLLPWRNRLWWQLISHKYLRISTPFLFLCALVSAVMLANSAFYRTLLMVSLFVVALAVTGLVLPKLKSRIISIPAAFLLLQIFVVRGFVMWLKIATHGHQGWK